MKNTKLKIAMIKKNIKGVEIAKHLNCDPGNFSKIVNGWITPNNDTKQKISDMLGYSPEELFSED